MGEVKLMGRKKFMRLLKKHTALAMGDHNALALAEKDGPRSVWRLKGGDLRAGSQCQYCPVTFVWDMTRGPETAYYTPAEYEKAAGDMEMCPDLRDLVVAAADNLPESCGSNRKAEVAAIRKELMAICKPPEALFLEVT